MWRACIWLSAIVAGMIYTILAPIRVEPGLELVYVDSSVKQGI